MLHNACRVMLLLLMALPAMTGCRPQTKANAVPSGTATTPSS